MEITDTEPVKVAQGLETKRPNFIQRLRKSITSFFRHRSNTKRNKSDSQIPKELLAPNIDEVDNFNSSLTNAQTQEIEEKPIETADSLKPNNIKLKPAVKDSLFGNDFTSELKQSLKLRSIKIEEGDKSPTDAIKQIEGLRTLSSITVDNEKEEVKVENETKTFEEKLALFESQISGGSGSVHDTLKRDKSPKDCDENEENKDDEWNNKEEANNDEDGKEHSVIGEGDDETGETKYTIDVVENGAENVEEELDEAMLVDGNVTEEYEVNGSGDGDVEAGLKRLTKGCVTQVDEDCDQLLKDVSGFVNDLIDGVSAAVAASQSETDTFDTQTAVSDVQ